LRAAWQWRRHCSAQREGAVGSGERPFFCCGRMRAMSQEAMGRGVEMRTRNKMRTSTGAEGRKVGPGSHVRGRAVLSFPSPRALWAGSLGNVDFPWSLSVRVFSPVSIRMDCVWAERTAPAFVPQLVFPPRPTRRKEIRDLRAQEHKSNSVERELIQIRERCPPYLHVHLFTARPQHRRPAFP